MNLIVHYRILRPMLTNQMILDTPKVAPLSLVCRNAWVLWLAFWDFTCCGVVLDLGGPRMAR
ncbi:hypothetical protein AN958_10500 [Leucoagaricus sp. SymC.cos]|nr:hypothetical protein AN958_10500 [Leucoagaricus sp. SymC.cos]